MLQEELSQFKKYVKHKQLRLTPQRERAVLHILERHDHFTPEELYFDLKKAEKNISRATVYRTLTLLEEAGFVEKLQISPNRTVYEHVIGHHHHDHLICTQCWRILEFVQDDIERLQKEIAEQNGFDLENHNLKLYGTCKEFKQTGACRYDAPKA